MYMESTFGSDVMIERTFFVFPICPKSSFHDDGFKNDIGVHFLRPISLKEICFYDTRDDETLCLTVFMIRQHTKKIRVRENDESYF